jgi:23S rRNA A1618 N6-methylase RlmF
VLLSEESPADIRKVAEKADRLLVLHCPQQHDTVTALPGFSDDEADVAAVKQRADKNFSGGKKRSKTGKPAAEAAPSLLCWYHARFGEKAHSCTSPCSWAEN